MVKQNWTYHAVLGRCLAGWIQVSFTEPCRSLVGVVLKRQYPGLQWTILVQSYAQGCVSVLGRVSVSVADGVGSSSRAQVDMFGRL